MLLGLRADVRVVGQLRLRGGADAPLLGPTPEYVSGRLWAAVPRAQLPAGCLHSGVRCPYTRRA